MEAEEFKKIALSKDNKDYGICAPPTNAQEGLNILIEHFLGEDWYEATPMGTEQVNTTAIYAILDKYPRKIDKWKKFWRQLSKR